MLYYSPFGLEAGILSVISPNFVAGTGSPLVGSTTEQLLLEFVVTAGIVSEGSLIQGYRVNKIAPYHVY